MMYDSETFNAGEIEPRLFNEKVYHLSDKQLLLRLTCLFFLLVDKGVTQITRKNLGWELTGRSEVPKGVSANYYAKRIRNGISVFKAEGDAREREAIIDHLRQMVVMIRKDRFKSILNDRPKTDS